MILKTIAGAALTLCGLLLSILGIMFIIASGKGNSRLISGIIMISAGLLLAVWGIILFRNGISESPEAIKEKILKLAGKNHGEIPEEVLLGEIGGGDVADFQLSSFLKSGVAKKTERKGRTFYLFSEFNAKLVVKQCPYCGNDYPVRNDIDTCSSCGGDLKLTVERLKGKEENYSMD